MGRLDKGSNFMVVLKPHHKTVDGMNVAYCSCRKYVHVYHIRSSSTTARGYCSALCYAVRIVLGMSHVADLLYGVSLAI